MPNYSDPPGFDKREATLPESFRRDPIWRTPAYRYACWLADLVKEDVRRLVEVDPHAQKDARQLLRAINAIGANLAEGYSSSTGPERAHYYHYSKATSREAKDWYFKARLALGVGLVEHRHGLLDRIIRILTAIIPRERGDATKRRRRTQDPTDDRRDDAAASGE